MYSGMKEQYLRLKLQCIERIGSGEEVMAYSDGSQEEPTRILAPIAPVVAIEKNTGIKLEAENSLPANTQIVAAVVEDINVREVINNALPEAREFYSL